MAPKFVHLHVHTEYSLLDGLSKIEKLIQTTKNHGMKSIAITDHGAMYGAVEFYKAAKSGGINPIIGMEGYSTTVDHKEKPDRKKFKNYHLLLLAKNEVGYKNLMKLTSIAHIEGYYYRPRFDKETLKKYSEGLICTSACPQGELASNILDDDMRIAKKTAQWFLDVFGEDYYLEIQNHEYDKFLKDTNDNQIKQELTKMADVEKRVKKGVLKISRDLGIPIVATNDAHYIEKKDAQAQDVLVCVATGRLVSETQRIRFLDNPSFYIKSPEEMADLFPDLPEALENTVKVANKCDLKISTLGKWFFPKFGLPKGKSAEDQLRDMTKKNLNKRVKKPGKEEKDRLKYELDIICDKGYAPYFLIVEDMIGWANNKGMVTNTRGSAAGSLVSYVLGITTVNPLEYYLPFERFLNPFRPSPPDIDFDVPDNRREEIIQFMVDRYGKEKVAQICTFGRMLSRAAVRDVSRVLGYNYATGDKISKLIPPPKQGFPVTIPKALEETPPLKQLYDTDKDAKIILDLAEQVEGSARHISVHAAGLVISPTILTDFTPIQKEPSGEKVITQYEMHACEDVGLIQFDILGIRNLAILGAAVENVEAEYGKKVDLWKIPLNDKKTYKMLSNGETMGVFQLSGSGMTRYIKELGPTRIEDLMVMVALYRPGPLAVIPEYIRRKKNPKLVKYLDPRMKKFLGSSFGLIVYQDDLLFCALDLAGYTWEEADKFRNAVGKKIPKEMAAQKEKFTKGIVENGQTEEFAEMLWKLFEPFQAYGFNKAHAASYGMIAYQTAYMKANYPVEFMAALLTAESKDTEKISAAVTECRRMGINVLAPDINESNVGFTSVDDKDSLNSRAIRFGLGAIKNVGAAAIEAITKERKKSKFLSFPDFLKRVDNRKVNKKVLESLIKVGALSEFGNRASLLSSIDEIRSKVVKTNVHKDQQDLFGDDEMASSSGSGSKEAISNIDEFEQDELTKLEKQLLGFSLSAKPLIDVLSPLTFNATHKIVEISDEELPDQNVSVAVVVNEVRIVITKKSGQEMAFVRVEDDTGSLDLVIFPKIFQRTRDVWVESNAVLVSGRVDFRDDSPSILVETIETKDSAARANNQLFIKIPKNTESNQIKKLRKLLLENPGEQKVTLVFEGKKQRIVLQMGISWSQHLTLQIAEIFDEGSTTS